MSESRRLLALTPFSFDLADQAALTGLADVLGHAADALDLEIILDQAHVADLPLRESTLQTIRESYDLLLLGPGAVLAPSPARESGWALDLPADLAIDVPYGFLSARLADGPFLGHPPEIAAQIHTVLEGASFVTVADRGTREVLGLGAEVAPRLCDPTLFTDPAVGFAVPGLDPLRPTITVSLDMADVPTRFPPPFQRSFEAFMGQTLRALRALVSEHRFQIVHAPVSMSEYDAELGQILAEGLPPGSTLELVDAVPGFYEDGSFSGPSRLASLYQSSHLVIGQSLGATLLAFVAGTPILAATRSAAVRHAHEELALPSETLLDLGEIETCVEHVLAAAYRAMLNGAAFAEAARATRDRLRDEARVLTRHLFEEHLRPARILTSPRVAP
jgi:hypothetical protein